MNGRDDRGRFARGNAEASAGGQARAARLAPERRREIARAGWLAVVAKRFGGDAEAAGAYLGKLGAWTVDRAAYGGSAIAKPDAYPHPRPMPRDASIARDRKDSRG